MVPSSLTAGHPQDPNPGSPPAWDRKNQLEGGGRNPRANSSPSARPSRVPGIASVGLLGPSPCPPASSPSSGEVGGGWVQGQRSRQGLSQSLSSQTVGGANFLPASGTWSLGGQFPRSWHSQELPTPNTLRAKGAAPGSYLQPRKLPTPAAPS